MVFLQIVWEFFKTGLFSVGGGLATLPFLKVIATKYPWFTTNDLLDMIAVSESTPGPIGINTATYAGFRAAGIPGALAATCALVFPSVVIIILIAQALTKFQNSPLVKNSFYGLRPASAGLILGAMLELFLVSLLHLEHWGAQNHFIDLFNLPAIALFIILSFFIWKLPKIHPVLFILAGAVCGIIFQF